MQKLATAAEMRALDRGAIRAGVPGLVLMENAGATAAAHILEQLNREAGPVTILCGKGNNGGDGFVIARLLTAEGCSCSVFLLGRASTLSGDAAINAKAWLASGGRVTELSSTRSFQAFARSVARTELVVDALFGTGLNSPVTGPAAKAIGIINRGSRGMAVAIDIPSGINADTGAVMGTAVRASSTVTFALGKPGLHIHPGSACAGSVVLANISIPPQHLKRFTPSFELITPEHEWAGTSSRSNRDSHKGSYGLVLVLGGSHGKSGAAVIAARGAHGGGAGLVTLAVQASLEAAVARDMRETMTMLLHESPGGGWTEKSLAAVRKALTKRHVLVTGPGMPVDEQSRKLFLKLLTAVDLPVVIDADGLNALAAVKRPPRLKNAVLTPHPGEAARLLGTNPETVQSDRVAAVRALAKKYRCIVVLKGAGTLVHGPGRPVRINPTGTPAMATGGMGDLLSGLIGGLLASTKLDPFDAASLAVWLHGRAGELSAAKLKRPSVTATEVWKHLGAAFADARTA